MTINNNTVVADLSITTAKLAAGAVTKAKLGTDLTGGLTLQQLPDGMLSMADGLLDSLITLAFLGLKALGYPVTKFDGGVCDTLLDESGIDTGNSTGQNYDSVAKCYTNGSPGGKGINFDQVSPLGGQSLTVSNSTYLLGLGATFTLNVKIIASASDMAAQTNHFIFDLLDSYNNEPLTVGIYNGALYAGGIGGSITAGVPTLITLCCTAGAAVLYIDGVIAGNADLSAVDFESTVIWFGNKYDGTIPFTGRILDFRFESTALYSGAGFSPNDSTDFAVTANTLCRLAFDTDPFVDTAIVSGTVVNTGGALTIVPSAMSLQTIPWVQPSVPTRVRMEIDCVPDPSLVLNTDLKAYASTDGTTWAEATLYPAINIPLSGEEVYRTNIISPGGTTAAILMKIVTTAKPLTLYRYSIISNG